MPTAHPEARVGLEVHVGLDTRRKLFCDCVRSFDGGCFCPYCARREGVPRLNDEAVKLAVISALALGCKVPRYSRFVRKVNSSLYLPGGYQLTQMDEPIARDGVFLGIRIERLQLEEDAARPTRDGIDYNRSGAPLLEIVTAPDFRDGDGARAWVEEVRQLLCRAGATDGRIERGSLRCDLNVSVGGGARVEVKGVASLRSVRRAIDAAIAMQSGEGAAGGTIMHWEERAKVLTLATQSYAYEWADAADVPRVEMSEERLDKIKRA